MKNLVRDLRRELRGGAPSGAGGSPLWLVRRVTDPDFLTGSAFVAGPVMRAYVLALVLPVDVSIRLIRLLATTLVQRPRAMYTLWRLERRMVWTSDTWELRLMGFRDPLPPVVGMTQDLIDLMKARHIERVRERGT